MHKKLCTFSLLFSPALASWKRRGEFDQSELYVISELIQKLVKDFRRARLGLLAARSSFY